MSRGCARTALKHRLQTIVESRQLPYKGSKGDLKTPTVCEQRSSVNNDGLPDAPSVTVKISKVKQTGDDRLGAVTIITKTYSEDSEQGYRDAENLIEAIEIDLISNPWLDSRYPLVGSWETDIVDDNFPVFFAALTCSVELPSIKCRVGPDGKNIEV
ncbi:MAG: hypothetical protein ABFD49_11170 [Armatimonadota bacterium]|nr:hypothetical protein [bacterium]